MNDPINQEIKQPFLLRTLEAIFAAFSKLLVFLQRQINIKPIGQVSNQIETQARKQEKNGKLRKDYDKKLEQCVHQHFKKGFSPLWNQTFISFTVRKLQGIGGGDQIRLHMSYYVKQAYQKFMDVIMNSLEYYIARMTLA